MLTTGSTQTGRKSGAGGGGESRLLDEVCGDRPLHRTQDQVHDLRLGGEQEAQGIRQRQHSLPNRLLGKDMIDQVGSGLDHPAGSAGAD
jgi:hypothetical protein